MRKTTFSIFCLEGAVLSFNVAATAAIIPSVAKEFGVAEFFAGQIVWLYMLPYGLAALLYGPLVRRFDAKKVELICFLFFVLSNLLAAVSNNIYMLFAARFFMGLFGASVIPLVLIIIAHEAKDKERGKLVGLFFSTTFVASLLGLFLSGIIRWRLIYGIPAVFGFLLWIHMWKYLPRFKNYVDWSLKVNYIEALKDKKIFLVFLYTFLISMFYHGTQQWLSVYFSQGLGLKQFVISMLITLTSFSGIFGEIAGGYLADKLGRYKAVLIGISLMLVSIFVLLLKLPVFILIILMLVWGFGWTINHAGLATMLTDFPKKFVNEAASLNSSVRFIAGGVGVYLSGLVMLKSFFAGFLSLGVGLVLLIIFSKKMLLEK